MPLDESVLCVPAAAVWDRLGRFTGFRPASVVQRALITVPSLVTFRPRRECETDPSLLQLIPYVVLTHGDDVFHYRRGSAGTEGRLRSLRSVGLGGHISEEDATAADPFLAGMHREIEEEVEIGCGYAERFLGLIFDPSTPVGEVHLGVAYRFELERPAVTPREAGIADAGFAPRTQLLAERDQFETWSRFVLEVLGNGGRMFPFTVTLGVINSRKAPQVVAVEPWANDYTLLPDERLEVVAYGATAIPRFVVVEWDGTTQVYCDDADDFVVTQDGRELECGHQRQP